jgi:pyruvate, water dikinase
MTTWIRWFDDVGINGVPVVGGNNASLGGMRQARTPLGTRTPDGFAITVDAYREFPSAAGLERVIGEVLVHLDVPTSNVCGRLEVVYGHPSPRPSRPRRSFEELLRPTAAGRIVRLELRRGRA